MKPFIIALFLVFAVSAPGCIPNGGTLTPQQRHLVNAERAFLLAKTVVIEGHRAAWSDPLRVRADECANVPSGQVSECMGVFTPEANRKIVQALEVYVTAARVAGDAILLAVSDPEAPDISALINDCLKAATAILGLIPQAKPYQAQLDRVLEGLLTQ